jgi:NADPH-dependent 2,4-dienoyl-CoA reductase/sulfur reductase-like enzyme
VETEAGILVDERMRTSIPTLFAAGDVAQGMNLMSGRSEIIALWASARYQGRAAGRSLAGAPGGYRGSIPSSISHVGRMLFASPRDYDGLTARREGDALELKVWRENKLVGVNLLNCCLSAGAMKQALQKATVETAAGRGTGAEASWISFNG